MIARQDLVDKENQRLEGEKKIKQIKDKNSEMISDKKFYLTKIVEQREDLKECKIAMAKKD